MAYSAAMKPIRWGIVGCGDVCEVKSGPALQKAEGSELVSVCRRQADKAEDFAERHGVPKWTADAQALIDDSEVDAVYVATPPGSHLDFARRVAAAGKPCSMEKPMARTHAECVAMNEAFAETRQKLFVAYYRRRLPRFVAVNQWIEAGRLGRVTSVDLVFAADTMLKLDPDNPLWRVEAVHAGGGLFFDMGSHALDVLDMLLGPVREAEGAARRSLGGAGVEDRVSAHLAFDHGVTGTGLWDFASGDSADRVTIRGTRGGVSFAVFHHAKVTLRIDGQESLHEFPDPPHVHQPLVQAVVDELHGKEASPSTGASAARTSAVMDGLTRDYYGGREEGFWDRPGTWAPFNN